MHPEFETRVSPIQRDAVIAKRDLERYYAVLQSHRDKLALTQVELDQVGSAIRGLSFDESAWVLQIPAVLAERYGDRHAVYLKLRQATMADLYAVLDAVERRMLTKGKEK